MSRKVCLDMYVQKGIDMKCVIRVGLCFELFWSAPSKPVPSGLLLLNTIAMRCVRTREPSKTNVFPGLSRKLCLGRYRHESFDQRLWLATVLECSL